MADYLIQGKKGSGKSLVVVSRIRDALREGRPVATNLDLNLDKLIGAGLQNVRVYRVPDRPTRADLDAIGIGNPDPAAEHKNGLLVLDEIGVWLNARTWGDKERAAVLDYFAHSRKLGWDTYFLCQGKNQIDKQLRESLCEYLVTCRRMDRLKVPVLGIKLPKVHVAFVKYGLDQHDPIAERWIYRGQDLYAAYNTRQVFKEQGDGLHCVLSPAQLGRKPQKSLLQEIRDAVRADLERRSIRPLKPKHPLVVLIERLPPDQRLKHLQRFESLGAFSC